MKDTSSYPARILDNIKCFFDTIFLYQKVAKYLIRIINKEWDLFKNSTRDTAVSILEKLAHKTEKNPNPKYKFFDKKFKNFPSYLRRAAIADAFGAVSSFKSLLENWEKSDKKNKRPHLKVNRNFMPLFYKDNMFKMLDGNKIRLKLLVGKAWKWVELSLSVSDIKYIRKHYDITTIKSPRLEKRHNKMYIRFSFEKRIQITKEINTILAVDLGMNNDAVISIMRQDGTVIARSFINFPKEKDRLYRILSHIAQAHKHGAKSLHKLWRYAKNYNKALSIMISSSIVNLAREYNVDVIVVEHLDSNMGKVYGSNKQKCHMWRKRDIIKRIEHLSHRYGMAFSTVNPCNTSKLAFDGSGKVKRSKDNYSICTFKTEKVYNTDLNASYNIGARYFIRNIIGSLSENQRLLAEAKVPTVRKRTNCTLSTLISLCAVVSV